LNNPHLLEASLKPHLHADSSTTPAWNWHILSSGDAYGLFPLLAFICYYYKM